MNTFIQQGHIQLIRNDIKGIYNVTKDFWIDIYIQSKLFSTLIIIIHVSLAANQLIRMISEGSCDTEGWSNDNSALITQE